MSKKQKILLLVLAILLLLVCGGYLIYKFYYSGNSEKNKTRTRNVNNANRNSNGNSQAKESDRCVSDLSQSDKDMIAGWKTFTNSKYNYSFQYPADWGEADTGENANEIISIVGMEGADDPENAIDLLFVSPDKASDFSGDLGTKASSKTATVDCVSADYSSYNTHQGEEGTPQRDSVTIQATFSKNNQQWLVRMIFPDLNSASLNSDYFETFDLVLKTIKFE